VDIIAAVFKVFHVKQRGFNPGCLGQEAVKIRRWRQYRRRNRQCQGI